MLREKVPVKVLVAPAGARERTPRLKVHVLIDRTSALWQVLGLHFGNCPAEDR
jgi:hypothetical protein